MIEIAYTYLLYYKASQAVTNEYYWSIFFLDIEL